MKRRMNLEFDTMVFCNIAIVTFILINMCVVVYVKMCSLGNIEGVGERTFIFDLSFIF